MLSFREIVQKFGADNVFIISKAGQQVAKQSTYWLFETIGIDEVTGFKTETITSVQRSLAREEKE